MAEGQDAAQGSGGVGLGDNLQKEINRREAFERKNAELEGVNDELRLENGELRTQVQMLRKKLEEMAAKPKSTSGMSSASNTPELHKKHQKSKQSSQKKQSSTPVHGAVNENHEEEVHTLRRERKALKDELEETKAKQLNFEAAFKTEFDLRTTMEEKYDSLKERYERLVIENGELRKALRQHNIPIPPPPSLRAKLRITADGPMKPPRRNKKRSGSLQPDTRPKSESVAMMMGNFYSHERIPQGEYPDSTSHRANSLSPRRMSASPSDHREFLFTELSAIEGSCEITSKPGKDKGTKEDSCGEGLDIGADKCDQSNGQPLQPSRTPTGDIRKVQSDSVENIAQQQSPSHHHQRSSSGSAMHAMSNASPAKGGASELTGQPETFRSQESVGVTITVSSEVDNITSQETIKDAGLNSNQLIENLQMNAKENGLKQESNQMKEINEEVKHHHIEQMSSDSDKVFIQNEELEEKNPGSMEWELDNLMAKSAQQLESAKAFYAEMHAHLKKKENSDNDSDD